MIHTCHLFFPSLPSFPPEIMLLWNMTSFLKLACRNNFLFNTVLESLKFADRVVSEYVGLVSVAL